MRNPLDPVSVSECHACSLLGKDHCPSVGPPKARVMFIGQSPGEVEVMEQVPFVGPAGEFLDFLLDEAELVREEVYIANVLKCRPPENRASRPEERANCWRLWLFHEIASVDPELVVCLGKDAHQQVMPRTVKFEHNVITRGRKRNFLTSYHPAYFLYNKQIEISVFLEVGQTIKQLLAGVEA